MDAIINTKLLANPMNWIMIVVILAFVVMLAFTFTEFSGIALPEKSAI